MNTGTMSTVRNVGNIRSFKPMLAQKYESSMNIDGYWASEKLDGIRALYYKGQFVTRTGKRL